MGRVGVTIPYLRQTPSGFYWEPSRKVKALGFAAESLGKEEAKAFARARKLNDQVAAEMRGDAPEPAAPIEGTVAWMIGEYKKSKRWKRLEPATQRGYRQCLSEIEEWGGDKRVEAITRKAAKKWQENIEERAPAFAAAIIRVLRVVMHFARDEGYKIQDDPFASGEYAANRRGKVTDPEPMKPGMKAPSTIVNPRSEIQPFFWPARNAASIYHVA